MKKNSVLRVFLVLALILAMNFIASNEISKASHYIAGDDLPIYIGTSVPRG